MSRYTKNSLISDLDILNAALEKQNLDYSIRYQSRNGYHSVDLYCGDNQCIRNIDCNETPKKLYKKAIEEFNNLMP